LTAHRAALVSPSTHKVIRADNQKIKVFLLVIGAPVIDLESHCIVLFFRVSI
jgi:hypothetical protein